MQKKKTIDDLNQFYESITSATKEIYSEQRSNTMLVAGNHYSSKNADYWNRIKDLKSIPQDQKLRLTKNHIKKITNAYVNNLVSTSPSVKITPRDNKSMQSRKSAELNDSVWQYARDVLELPMVTQDLAHDFIELGECAVKVFWNPLAGKPVGVKQKLDDQGQPMVDEAGQPVPDEKNFVHEGKLEIEIIPPTNLGVDLSATTFEKSPMVFVRKMVPTEFLKQLVGNDPDKLKMIQEDKKDESMIFDPASAEYQKTKDMTLFIEYFIRPCGEYPNGYYFGTTKNGILFEAELPYGHFPIEYCGFDRISGNPRHRSIIKQLRPFQLEINRTASKIAEHQITSDDKILIQSGTKLSSGMNMAGIRVIQYQGQKPEVLEGRTGAQYVDYMMGQITEMYQISNVMEDSEFKEVQGADPMGLLFRSVRDQKKFVIYVAKFENFLKKMCKLYLKLAKEYLDEDMLIPMVGKAEMVNISEFKNTQEIDTIIEVVPMSDDINMMFGKWMTTNHLLQYNSQQLGPQQIAQLAKNLPYGNFEEAFADVTIDYDSATNFMLAIERGEQPKPSVSDNKTYMVKKLENRMRQSDFVLLNPQVQQYYQVVVQQYQDMIAQEQAAIQRAQSGFIPTTGPLIRTDLKAEVPNASGGKKTVSKSFPIDALSWLEKQMETQGASVQTLMELSQSSQAQIASQLQPPNQPNGMGQQMAAQPQGDLNGIGRTNQFNRPINR